MITGQECLALSCKKLVNGAWIIVHQAFLAGVKPRFVSLLRVLIFVKSYLATVVDGGIDGQWPPTRLGDTEAESAMKAKKNRMCLGIMCVLSLYVFMGCIEKRHTLRAPLVTIVKQDSNGGLPTTRELVKGHNPFKRICIIPFKNFSLNPVSSEEVTDILLTELYFSNIFSEIVENEDTKAEMKKLSSIKALVNRNLVLSIGKKLGVDAFLFGVINQDNNENGDSILFDMTFSLIDAASGENVWSINVNEKHDIAASSHNRFLMIKNIVRKVLADFKKQAPKIKRKVVVVQKREDTGDVQTAKTKELQAKGSTLVFPKSSAQKRSIRQREKLAENSELKVITSDVNPNRQYQAQSYANQGNYGQRRTPRKSQQEYYTDRRKRPTESKYLEIPVQQQYSYSNTNKTRFQEGFTEGYDSSVKVPTFKYLRRKRIKKAISQF